MQENTKFSYEDFQMTPYLKKLTFFASGGPFLDGYILIIIGIALTQITTDLQINTFWQGLIASASLIGIFIGGGLFGYLTDIIGRNRMFTIDLIVLVVLSIMCMFITAAWQLFILRFLIGVAIGADYPIATSLIIEFTPKKNRAITMGIIAGVWFLGAAVADIVGYFLSVYPHSWTWMLGSGAIPGILILLGRLGTPESPVWLAHKGRIEEATAIVKKIFGPNAELELDEEHEKTSFFKVFSSGYLKRILFCGLLYITEFAPASAILIFAPTILELFGLGEGRSALLGDVVVSMFFFIGCMVVMFFIQAYGRRPLAIWSYVLMTICMAVLTFFSTGSVVLILCAFALYAFFAGVPGILVWLYPNELFPTEIRATAVGISVAMSRIAVCITTFIVPYTLDVYGVAVTMGIMLVLTVIGLFACIAWAPETKNMSLKESSKL